MTAYASGCDGAGQCVANSSCWHKSPKAIRSYSAVFANKRCCKAKTFHRVAIRGLTAIIDVCGYKACSDYRTTDAGKVRDALLDSGLNASSVRRMFNTIKSIFNLAIAEHGLDMRNPFSSIYLPENDSKKRVSIPVETIRQIQ